MKCKPSPYLICFFSNRFFFCIFISFFFVSNEENEKNPEFGCLQNHTECEYHRNDNEKMNERAQKKKNEERKRVKEKDAKKKLENLN